VAPARFVEHRRYLDALLEGLNVRERVTLVVHDYEAEADMPAISADFRKWTPSRPKARAGDTKMSIGGPSLRNMQCE
jgi:hypothetical protein